MYTPILGVALPREAEFRLRIRTQEDFMRHALKVTQEREDYFTQRSGLEAKRNTPGAIEAQKQMDQLDMSYAHGLRDAISVIGRRSGILPVDFKAFEEMEIRDLLEIAEQKIQAVQQKQKEVRVADPQATALVAQMAHEIGETSALLTAAVVKLGQKPVEDVVFRPERHQDQGAWVESVIGRSSDVIIDPKGMWNTGEDGTFSVPRVSKVRGDVLSYHKGSSPTDPGVITVGVGNDVKIIKDNDSLVRALRELEQEQEKGVFTEEGRAVVREVINGIYRYIETKTPPIFPELDIKTVEAKKHWLWDGLLHYEQTWVFLVLRIPMPIGMDRLLDRTLCSMIPHPDNGIHMF